MWLSLFRRFFFAVFYEDVPLLLGMDNLSKLGALIDTENKRVCFLKISPKVYQCECLPGGYMAINLSDPTFWSGQSAVP